MKLSEMIAALQDDLAKGGDRDVVLRVEQQLLPNSYYDFLINPSFLPRREAKYVIYPTTRRY